MKISELIERLGELQGEHGDCDVFVEIPENEYGWKDRNPEPEYLTRKINRVDDGVYL